MKYLLICIILTQTLFSQELKLRENYNSEMSSIVGSLTSSNIFLTYLSQDLIYNSFKNKNLKETEVKVLINTLTELSSQIDINLKELYQISESQKDADLILVVINVLNELKYNNDLLISYVQNPNDENHKNFLTQQKNIWNKLKKMN